MTVALKDKAYCEGNQNRCSAPGCPLYGTPGRPGRDEKRRVRGCMDPAARGKRNRKSGLTKQRVARKALGIPPNKFGDANEENWSDPEFATEVKSGKQCGPVANAWRRAEAQVMANRPDHGGQHKATRIVWMPEGWGERGLVTVTTETWRELVYPALREYSGGL